MYLHCLKVAILVVLAKFERGQVRAGKLYLCLLNSGGGGLNRGSGADEEGNNNK